MDHFFNTQIQNDRMPTGWRSGVGGGKGRGEEERIERGAAVVSSYQTEVLPPPASTRKLQDGLFQDPSLGDLDKWSATCSVKRESFGLIARFPGYSQ